METKILERIDHCQLGKNARFAKCRLECGHCGWNDEVAAQRKQIPLRWCEDGLWRKILPPRPDETGNEAGI